MLVTLLAEKNGNWEISFPDDEFIKKSIQCLTDVVCPFKSQNIKNIRLSRATVAYKIWHWIFSIL